MDRRKYHDDSQTPDRSLENQRRQRSRVFEGVQQCGNPRAFAKPRGVSASETESHSPLLPSSVESLFPAPRKRLGFFTVVSFPEADGLTPPAPVIATDRKQTGPRCSRLYRLSSARFLTSKIDRDFDVRKAAPRRRARPIFRDRFGLRDVVHSARVVNEASRVNLSVVRANIIA